MESQTPEKLLDEGRLNAKLFDKLDFEAWNAKNWELFRELHTSDVKVVSGPTVTHGIEAHVQAMQTMLAAVDSVVDSHDVVFGCGEWTCGLATATNKGQDGQNQTMTICTVARWRAGQIAEEYLFMSPAANE